MHICVLYGHRYFTIVVIIYCPSIHYLLLLNQCSWSLSQLTMGDGVKAGTNQLSLDLMLSGYFCT